MVVEKERINIKKLFIDEPGPYHIRTDPKNLITKEDLGELKHQHEILIEENSYDSTFELSKLLVYEKIIGLDIPQPSMLKRIKGSLSFFYSQARREKFGELSSYFKYLMPEEYIGVGSDFTELSFEFRKQRREPVSRRNYSFYLALNHIYPKNVDFKLIQEEIDHLQTMQFKQDMLFYPGYNVFLKILAPGKEEPLSEADENKIIDSINKMREMQNWDRFLEDAANMRILASKRAWIDEDGFHLDMPENAFDDGRILDLPKVKRYKAVV